MYSLRSPYVHAEYLSVIRMMPARHDWSERSEWPDQGINISVGKLGQHEIGFVRRFRNIRTVIRYPRDLFRKAIRI